MGNIWVKEFTGGLDVRRLPETTPGGVLVRGSDGHITRGGEFEKRAAFVLAHQLSGNTIGLAQTKSALVVFGSSAQAPILPTGVHYQRLQHPLGLDLTEVLSHDLYDAKLYVVARFADGSIHHFYDGVRVDDWFDGRARTSFRVSGGNTSSTLDMIYVAGVPVISAPVTWATSNEATAAAVAAAIEGHTSVPEYGAYAVGDTVYVIANAPGAEPNGRSVELALAGGFVTQPASGAIPALAGGGLDGGNPATGAFTITAGPGTILPSVGGVALTSAAVAWAGSADETAVAVAAAINAHTSVPDYEASASGATVTVTTKDNTDAVNGQDITFALTGGMSVQQGGARGTATFTVGAGVLGATIIVKVGGVSLFTTPVSFSSSATATATAIAVAINAHTSVPDYEASASGSVVTIRTAANTDQYNGLTISFTKVGAFPTSNVSAVANGASPSTTMTPMSGGKADDAFTPGLFVKTVGSKIYSTAGSILHFSGIKAPTQWTTDAIGAGFINLASENSGSEELVAVERYQNLLAVFAEQVVQVWYVDPDPELNRQSQVLNNTGTFAPRSVTQFGDDDIFYLDASGLRSLRARDSSNAASTTDIGVPIDALLLDKLASMTTAEREAVIGLINPLDKRFWLILKDEVFVFSFFANAKVSAWTTYNLVAYDGADEVPFTADAALVHKGRVYIRSGQRIYAYGGVAGALVYDATEADAWLPPLDANTPTQQKAWVGVDVAARGTWQISAAQEPTNGDFSEVIANISETTYNMHRVAMNGRSTHIGIRCRSAGEGPAVLSSVVIHYQGGASED